MIKVVVFDVGGVLAYDVWEYFLLDKKEGILSICDLEEGAVTKAGKDLWEEFAYRGATEEGGHHRLEEEYWNRFINRFGLSQSAKTLIDMTDKFIKPVEGMIPLLEKLKSKGIGLAICSNNNEFWFKRQMDKLGLYRFFRPDKVILSCRVGFPKSSAGLEMFRAVLDAVGVEATSCVFVDDRAGNIERALSTGMVGVFFPSHAEYGARYLDTLLTNMGV